MEKKKFEYVVGIDPYKEDSETVERFFVVSKYSAINIVNPVRTVIMLPEHLTEVTAKSFNILWLLNILYFILCMATMVLPFTAVYFGKGTGDLLYWLSLVPVLFGGILGGRIIANPPHGFWKYKVVQKPESGEL